MLKTDALRQPLPEADAAAPNPTFADIGLDRFAPYLLNRISARWNSDLQLRLKEHGLTTIQMRTLAVLSIMSGATVNELAVYTVTEQSTMSRALESMVREGLVSRQQRAGDARVREVHLTEAGRDAFRRFWPEMHEAFTRMFAGLSQNEYETFVGLLTRILRNIRQHDF